MSQAGRSHAQSIASLGYHMLALLPTQSCKALHTVPTDLEGSLHAAPDDQLSARVHVRLHEACGSTPLENVRPTRAAVRCTFAGPFGSLGRDEHSVLCVGLSQPAVKAVE